MFRSPGEKLRSCRMAQSMRVNDKKSIFKFQEKLYGIVYTGHLFYRIFRFSLELLKRID